MLTITTCLWEPNQNSRHFSRCYDESWADKLYRGFKRSLSDPFRFVVFTDKKRKFQEPIAQERIDMKDIHYGACIEPFRLDCPQIFVGLDTIVVGNCDALAHYCMTADKPAIPKDPYHPNSVWERTNAVVLAPKGCRKMLFDGYAGENDMEWINGRDVNLLDEVFPGAVMSYKGHVQYCGLEEENKIIFFHGCVKPHDLPHVGWVARMWHDNERAMA